MKKLLAAAAVTSLALEPIANSAAKPERVPKNRFLGVLPVLLNSPISFYCLITLIWLATIYWQNPQPNSVDLASTYIAARLINRGSPEAIYQHRDTNFAQGSHLQWNDERTAAKIKKASRYIYPPFYASLFSPIAKNVSFATFNTLFLFVNIFSGLFLFILSAKLWYPKLLGRLPYATALVLMLFWDPLAYSIHLGQISPFISLLMLVSITLEKRQRSILAGALLSFCACLKLVPAALTLYWLVNKRWRALGVFFVTTVVIILLHSVLWPNESAHYLANLSGMAGKTLTAYNNQSLIAWFSRIILNVKDIFLWQLITPPVMANVLAALFFVFVSMLNIYCVYRGRKDPRVIELVVLSVIFVFPLIFMSISWNHYFVGLLPPMICLLQFSSTGVRLSLFIVAALNLFPIVRTAPRIFDLPLFWISSELLSAIIFTTVCVYLAYRMSRSETANPSSTCI